MKIEEMSFYEFESRLIKKINDMLYDNSVQTYHIPDNIGINLYWTNKEKKDIAFTIEMNHDFSYIHYFISVYSEDMEDGYHSNGGCNVPHSEEEHFQLSTVQDLGFSWEFYQYIVDVFKKIKE